MRLSVRAAGLLFVGTLVTVTGCGTGNLDSAEISSSAAPPGSASASVPGPTLVVTVPDLLPGGSPGPSSASATAPASPAPASSEPVAPAAPTGEGLSVSLANCDGCTVLATHRDVTGDLSAALVGTGARAILLSVGSDGESRGVIGVPYGAAFPAPDGGVLPCAAGTCVVQGRQPDGRAMLSAFELTDTGAWRDVSGDDAFPSATENGAVIDVGDRLAIAVQDQAEGAAVWVLYTWDGTRYAVVGCAGDGPPPTSVEAVSPDICLS